MIKAAGQQMRGKDDRKREKTEILESSTDGIDRKPEHLSGIQRNADSGHHYDGFAVF